MPEFAFITGGFVHSYGAVSGASSLSTQLTADSSTPNTKGAVVELTGATTHDAAWVLVQLSGSSAGSGADYLVDLMIGDSPEQVIIPDMYVSARAGTADFGPYLFPIFIPAGSRLSARCQCSAAGASLRISVVLIAPTLLMGGSRPSVVASYGATANSLGTNIDPGATANTDSAWVEITSATVRDHHWLVIAGRFGDRSITAAASWRLSIGIGAAPEQVLIPDLHMSADVTSDATYCPVVCLPVFIPAGSRLTARVRSSVTTDGDRDVWLRLYGV
jgi:hypothetical protein